MESHVLTISRTDAGQLVLPRRVELSVRDDGGGRFDVSGLREADAAWCASIAAAWDVAKALAGRPGASGHLRVAAPAPMQGASAGAPVGLLALACLLERPAPRPHFATGGVLAPEGTLEGGWSARVKAEAAAGFAPQLGMRDCAFVTPPVPGFACPSGLEPVLATDLASAYARLDPEGYEDVRERHRALRAGAAAAHGLAEEGLVASVRTGRAPAWPEEAGGARLRVVEDPAMGDAAWVGVAEDGLLLWRAPVPPGEDPMEAVARIVGMARAHARR